MSWSRLRTAHNTPEHAWLMYEHSLQEALSDNYCYRLSSTNSLCRIGDNVNYF